MSTGLIIGAFFLGILVVLILITLHELGHFIMAKISGAYVYEFAIGFGPRILTFKGKETWISIRIFPLGGFVSIASDDVDPPKGREDEIIADERKLENVARWKKAFFIVFGPLMNLFIAVLITTTIFMATLQKPNDLTFYGQRLTNNQIAYRLINEKEEENNNVGIGNDLQKFAIIGWETQLVNKNDDSDLTTISSKKLIAYGSDLKRHAQDYKTIVYSFLDEFKDPKYDLSNNDDVYGQIKFNYVEIDKYDGSFDINNIKQTNFSTSEEWNFNAKNTTVGISAPTRYYQNTNQAYKAGWEQVGTDTLSLLKAFGMLFTGHISQLAGPIGVASQTAQMIQAPSTFFLYVSSISANLFMLNMIPIPPLDGYKFLENAAEAITKKELNKKAKYIIYTIGALLFVALFITITIKDIIFG